VVRADGSAASKKSMLSRDHDSEIQSGERIVVPFEIEHLPRLSTEMAVTRIAHNLAVADAAVKYF
jgi:hypothetical protein